jgi:hypothetical protein
MSFSNIEMIHLYIYFKQENAKKIYIFSVFCGIVFCKTQLAGKLLRRNASSGSHVHIGKKQYPRMFLGTILLKGCHQEMLKYLFYWFSIC